jgi:chaperonin GroES
MKIQPLGNRVLIQRSKKETSKGGIFLPDTAQEKPKEGEVLAVGLGKMNEQGEVESLAIKKGDRVLFSSYAGTEVGGEEKEQLILSEDEILGIIHEA